ncbi:unnamed protein product [Prorocentrum cordatum]|uniref:Uncharacterized protein n=1 Tax=Prorocentrum cordatum TaxID=2364126 RepID=A0ABN9WEZ1_9DINO|nr:unnamed protein product [Polarella glacialis]|mmetsp:Transcript_24235/g.63276  ORF Transcript_24235/g.63276 Transcript_24235/m.63276 type:complete len:202 (+) Transcript_24235:28-633(+)
MACAQAAVSCAFLLLVLAPSCHCDCAPRDVAIDGYSVSFSSVLLLQAALRFEKVENVSARAAGGGGGAPAGGNLTAEASGRRHPEIPQQNAAYSTAHQLVKHRLEAARARLAEARRPAGAAQAPHGPLQALQLAGEPSDAPGARLPLLWLGGPYGSGDATPFAAALGYHLALLVAVCIVGCCWREDGRLHQEVAKQELSAS